jgi:hypothetical protein
VNGDLKFLARTRRTGKTKNNHHDLDRDEHTTFTTIIITTESNHGSDLTDGKEV